MALLAAGPAGAPQQTDGIPLWKLYRQNLGHLVSPAGGDRELVCGGPPGRRRSGDRGWHRESACRNRTGAGKQPDDSGRTGRSDGRDVSKNKFVMTGRRRDGGRYPVAGGRLQAVRSIRFFPSAAYRRLRERAGCFFCAETIFREVRRATASGNGAEKAEEKI